ncbi:MAG: hypothetical protein ACF8XB_14205 [Planctomycetota bacterium JB042]
MVRVPAGWTDGSGAENGWVEVASDGEARLAARTRTSTFGLAFVDALARVAGEAQAGVPNGSEERWRGADGSAIRIRTAEVVAASGRRFVAFALVRGLSGSLAIVLDGPPGASDELEALLRRVARASVVDRNRSALVAPETVGVTWSASRAEAVRRSLIGRGDVVLSPSARAVVLYERDRPGRSRQRAERLASKLDVTHALLERLLPAPAVPPRTALYRLFSNRRAFFAYVGGAWGGVVYRRDGDEAVLCVEDDDLTNVAFQLAVDDHFDRTLDLRFESDWLHHGVRALIAGDVGPPSTADGPWDPGARLGALLDAPPAAFLFRPGTSLRGDVARFVRFLSESERGRLKAVWAARVAGAGAAAERRVLLEGTDLPTLEARWTAVWRTRDG